MTRYEANVTFKRALADGSLDFTALLLIFSASFSQMHFFLADKELVSAQKSEAIGLLFSVSVFCHTHCLLLLFVLAAYSSFSLSHRDGSITIPHTPA